MTDGDEPILTVPQSQATVNIRTNPAAYWKSTVGRVDTAISPPGSPRNRCSRRTIRSTPSAPASPWSSKRPCWRADRPSSAPFRRSAFIDRNALTRYNVPSMWHEFERCLVDPSPMRDVDLAVPLPDGSVRDTHYYAQMVLRSMDALRNRRAAARRAFNRIRQAKVIILTLGLNEVWYDPMPGATSTPGRT